ncbi:MAG: alkaline phosphatase [Candidatus Zophobacter franzmannii]|nr:alkaline phosphatase [Candidatus Zophobacter franzmannii]
MKKFKITLLLMLLIVVSINATPKNIIVCIGDGMGFNHVKVGDYYEFGEEGKQAYENFPVKLAMSTWSLTNGGYDSKLAWESFKYLKSGIKNEQDSVYVAGFTDSAASATAMSTGVKTKNGILGFDENGNKLKSFGERATDKGKSVGFVTTVPYCHATPAGFVTNKKYRKDYHDIAMNIVFDSNVAVAIGGANPDMRDYKPNKYIGPKDFWEWLPTNETQYNDRIVNDIDEDGQPDPWTLMTKREDFVKYGTGDTPKRILGVYESAKNGQQTRGGDDKADAFVVPFDEKVPTLSEMTATALNVLDNDEDGFFLLVEGGAIDYAGHYRQPGRLVEEMLDFNATIRFIENWVEENSSWKETLVIVTADHETGCVWGKSPGEEIEEFVPVQNNGIGKMPGFTFYSGNHTNSLVPFYAKGRDAKKFKRMANEKDSVRGKYLDNAEMGQVLHKLWK